MTEENKELFRYNEFNQYNRFTPLSELIKEFYYGGNKYISYLNDDKSKMLTISIFEFSYTLYSIFNIITMDGDICETFIVVEYQDKGIEKIYYNSIDCKYHEYMILVKMLKEIKDQIASPYIEKL